MNKSSNKKIAMLCSGGNAPGMNNVLIGLARKCLSVGYQPILVFNGYKGLIDKEWKNADLNLLQQFACRGNVYTKSARLPEFSNVEVRKIAANNLLDAGIDTLVAIGGDGTYHGANGLSKLGIKTIAIPGTIDNDVASTQYTIGFDSCMNQIVRNVDSIRDSFDSHKGVVIVECMGRRWPDLTILAGIGLNVDYIVTGDNILQIKDFIEIARHAKTLKDEACIFLVAEKIYGYDGLPTLNEIAKAIEAELNCITRFSVIGYIQRGGSPSAYDRTIANVMSDFAIDSIINNNVNKAICYSNNELSLIDIDVATSMKKENTNKKYVNIFNKINSF